MEFNTNKKADVLNEAVKPRQIKAQTNNWTSLEGYVYVISKKMPIRQDGKMINCVKIGMKVNYPPKNSAAHFGFSTTAFTMPSAR